MNSQILDIIQTICSVLGLIVSLYVASNVISIKKSFNTDNSNKVKQEKNKVKNGDIAGRDIHK